MIQTVFYHYLLFHENGEKSNFSLVAIFNGCLEMEYLLSNINQEMEGKLFNRRIENILAAGTFNIQKTLFFQMEALLI